LEKIKAAIKKRKKLYKLIVTCISFIRDFIRDRKTLYYATLKIQTLINHRYKLHSYRIMSVKDYCTKNNLPYRVVVGEKTRDICVPAFFGERDKEVNRTSVSPEIYVAELFEVDIIGANSFLTKVGCCLYDMAVMDDEKRYDLRFESLKIVNKNNAIVGSFDSGQAIDEAVFLLGFASFNYFHFTIELMSKLKFIDSHEEYHHIPILIDEIVLKIPQLKQLFQAMNKYNHQIIPIEKQRRYMVKRLIYPSDSSWMPINVKDDVSLKDEDFMVAKEGIEYVQQTVLKKINSNTNKLIATNRKIFISRKHNKRLINEEEVIELFLKNGFEIIYPEEFSFKEQVEMFSNAKYVAGTTGAAFTNIIYCSSNATIICIIPKKYKFYMYSTIGKLLGLKPVFLDARITKKGKKISGDQFELDLNYCKEFLKTL